MRISVWSADVCSSDFEQPPHGALRHLHPVLPLQVPDDLRKRDVALSFDQPQGLRSVSLEVVRAVISALRAGLKVARPLPLIDPLDRRRGRYPKRSEEHTSELQSLMRISYAVFCLKKKKNKKIITA